jgi:sigma-B regulation protein RsbU (phosphoserine phosphatase)
MLTRSLIATTPTTRRIKSESEVTSVALPITSTKSFPVRLGRFSFSYRASLILSLSLLVVVTGLTVSFFALRGARSSTAALANSLFQEVSAHAVTKTRTFVLRATPIAQALGNLADLGLATDDSDRLARQLAAILGAHSGISWISYSDEAGSFVGAYRDAAGVLRVNQSHIENGRSPVREYDVLPGGDWKLHRDEPDNGYDPRTRPFYQRAKAARRLVWQPPYIFYDQSVPGITCANPFFDKAGRLRGVLTVDFDLNSLSQFVRNVSMSPNAQLFIMTADGVVLAHPTQRIQIEAGQREHGELTRIENLNDPLLKAFNAQLTPQDRTNPKGQDHARQFEFVHDGVPYYARTTAFSIDQDLTWIVGAVAPQSDFLSHVQQTMAFSVSASLIALVLAVWLAWVFARRVSQPVVSLVSLVNKVGAGDLDARAELGGPREFRQLSSALNRMIDDLRDRERLRTGMAVAMEVQQRLLPIEPPKIAGLDIAGFSAYCDETGGDYFDYIRPDQNSQSLLLAIGDVMGHGIGSALLMASARAILRSRISSSPAPGALLTHLNRQIASDLTGGQFMTMFLGWVDPTQSVLHFASAGHDPAMIYDPGRDEFYQTERGNIPLGIEAGAVYAEQTFALLKPGSILILATDGLWDAVNPRGDYFGKQRLEESIRRVAHLSAKEITAVVRRDLTAFRAGAHQRDDITLVVVKIRQP